MDTPFRLFCIGASAGGHQAIVSSLSQVPADINAAFLVIIHSAFDAPNNFITQLQKKLHLTVVNAEDNLKINPGHVYLGVPDHHLFVQQGKLRLTNGPRENLFRPSIDVLFRSAAVDYQNKCVGVLLTGKLNDGTAGLGAIKRCGGIAVIQNPRTAEFADMPFSAQESVEIDLILNLNKIAASVVEICKNPLPPKREVPESLIREASIAMKIKSQIALQESLGEQVPLSCGSCGGPLWKMDESGIERYRCHVGHSFSQEALLHSQDNKLEETLWVSLRTFEEKKILLKRMMDEYRTKGFQSMVSSYENKLAEVSEHIDRLRSLMKLHD